MCRKTHDSNSSEGRIVFLDEVLWNSSQFHNFLLCIIWVLSLCRKMRRCSRVIGLIIATNILTLKIYTSIMKNFEVGIIKEDCFKSVVQLNPKASLTYYKNSFICSGLYLKSPCHIVQKLKVVMWTNHSIWIKLRSVIQNKLQTWIPQTLKGNPMIWVIYLSNGNKKLLNIATGKKHILKKS